MTDTAVCKCGEQLYRAETIWRNSQNRCSLSNHVHAPAEPSPAVQTPTVCKCGHVSDLHQRIESEWFCNGDGCECDKFEPSPAVCKHETTYVYTEVGEYGYHRNSCLKCHSCGAVVTPAVPAASEDQLESRSVQRRVAAMKSEAAPTFTAPAAQTVPIPDYSWGFGSLNKPFKDANVAVELHNDQIADLVDRIKRAEAIIAELVKDFKRVKTLHYGEWQANGFSECYDIARAAIARAAGKES